MTEKEGETARKGSSILQPILHITTWAKAGPGQSQEPKTPFGSTRWVAGATAFTGATAESWIRNEQPVLEPALVQDAALHVAA